MAEPLLVVQDLSVGYVQGDGSVIRAVEDISFTLNRGETLGLCGESGCGKSTLVYGLLRTLAAPGAVLGGSVMLDGHDLLAMHDEGLRKLRWKTASIVPQSALNALNPVLTIRAHVRDTLVAHGEFSRDVADGVAPSSSAWWTLTLYTWPATPMSCPVACVSEWPWRWLCCLSHR